MTSEYELANIVSKKFKNYDLFEEVAFFRRSIDLVLIDNKNSILKTIEFKMTNWKQAIVQAVDHQIIADYAYLCMPKRGCSNQMLEQLDKHGLGLYLYDHENDTLELIVESKKSDIHSLFYKTKVMTRLQNVK